MIDLKIMAGFLLPGVAETHGLPPWISQIFVVKICKKTMKFSFLIFEIFVKFVEIFV